MQLLAIVISTRYVDRELAVKSQSWELCGSRPRTFKRRPLNTIKFQETKWNLEKEWPLNIGPLELQENSINGYWWTLKKKIPSIWKLTSNSLRHSRSPLTQLTRQYDALLPKQHICPNQIEINVSFRFFLDSNYGGVRPRMVQVYLKQSNKFRSLPSYLKPQFSLLKIAYFKVLLRREFMG